MRRVAQIKENHSKRQFAINASILGRIAAGISKDGGSSVANDISGMIQKNMNQMFGPLFTEADERRIKTLRNLEMLEITKQGLSGIVNLDIEKMKKMAEDMSRTKQAEGRIPRGGESFLESTD